MTDMKEDIRSGGEFGFISEIRKMFPEKTSIKGIGDDCAILPQRAGLSTLMSTDMLVEDIHFILSKTDPFRLGWKSLAVNLSDMAAMGGKPVASLLSLALPSNLPAGWLERFMEGYRDISARYDTVLAGGDTSSSKDRLFISVTVVGECPEGGALTRAGARPGDLVCVTGILGESAAGLDIILGGGARNEEDLRLVRRHFMPEPRVREGQLLASVPGVHSMMDLSDGVASDIRRIMEESSVGAEMDSRNPAYFGEHALDGGEDYELLFTVDPSAQKSLPVEHFVIGKITDSGGLVWRDSDRDFCGFRHF